MIIRFTPRAVADIEDIAEYIKIHSPRAALRIEHAITASIDHLAQHPNLGTARPHLGVRALGVPRFPYTVYYRVDPDAVVIVHVRGDRRKPLITGDL